MGREGTCQVSTDEMLYYNNLRSNGDPRMAMIRKPLISPFCMPAAARLVVGIGALILLWGAILWAVSA